MTVPRTPIRDVGGLGGAESGGAVLHACAVTQTAAVLGIESHQAGARSVLSGEWQLQRHLETRLVVVQAKVRAMMGSYGRHQA